ncbi:glycoside hydrolase family 97 protein [Altererythrobacter arenosus]|uniref:Glycoside hydrolase family 97 protein n=1 Tax=Altererythrobacter arenosus TaxID=3032592 RepID=A0ABY8FQ76_9SPHN|nr:glycoside hydrolase family 97 protein [Altererythrobacter sp. CAU 1644]WFL76405.1 glycoside hydrolase family 97 protein [Altererythrobacter sp. CAU 1644]
MKIFSLSAFVAIALSAPAALAEEVVTSPDGQLTVAVDVNGEGRPFYRIEKDGEVVLSDSRLGFLLTDQDKLERRLAITGATRASHDETWEQPWGERRFVRDRHNELTVRFEEASDEKRKFGVTFRVFDDGVGFRYLFDDASMGETVRIAEELTEFNIASDGTAWWIPGGEWNRYEYLYEKTPISGVSVAHTPLTFRMENGTHLAIHEAALVDFAGMWIKRTTGTNFRATLAPTGSTAARAVRDVPFATPWRTIRVSDDAAGLAMSDIELNLNEPNKLDDVSWFKPHKYVGVWWSLHLDEESWGRETGSGSDASFTAKKHGATTENVKRYIDFAAEHGFEGVLVEGWNIGWDGNWFFNGGLFSFTEAYPDYDFEELARYAAEKGVPIVGHHETSGDIGNYESQLEAGLDLMAARGVKSIKSGYVTDACNLRYVHPDGRETRECTESQVMQRHHLKVVTEAAKRKIAINPHEPVKDTGLRRTYPNWVSREGARGMEFNAWGVPPNGPSHVPTMAFTRMLSGPMDYTPGVLSLEGRGQPLQMTQARALAEYVVIYSPIQMAADLPEHYAEHMDAFQFIKNVPADWSESLILAAEVGEYVVTARKDRNSDAWYVGGATDEQARTSVLELDFLDPGKSYTATIYRDGPNAHFEGEGRFDIVIEKRTVRSGDAFELTMAPGGGFAIAIVPQ